MITKIVTNQIDSLIKQLTDGVGQEGFLNHACNCYRQIMNFQQCHFAHLQDNGKMIYENDELSQPFLTGILKYQEEDIWRPENSGIPITQILHNRIDKSLCFDLSKKTNLYDWMYSKVKAYDSFGTIHPCYTAFSCIKMDGDQLDENEAEIHYDAALKIINLYYLHHKLKKGELFEKLYLENEKIYNKNKPVIIINEWNYILHEGSGFLIEIKKLHIDFQDLLQTVKNFIAENAPVIENFEESYEIVFRSREKKILFTVKTLLFKASKYFFISFRIMDNSKPETTPREQEILRLIYAGMSNDEIAEELFISNFTVKKHISNMMLKADVNNRILLLKTHGFI